MTVEIERSFELESDWLVEVFYIVSADVTHEERVMWGPGATPGGSWIEDVEFDLSPDNDLTPQQTIEANMLLQGVEKEYRSGKYSLIDDEIVEAAYSN